MWEFCAFTARSRSCMFVLAYTSEFVVLGFVIVHTALYCYSSILDHVVGLALLCFIYE